MSATDGAKVTRVVALGASNLTRGLHAFVSTVRTAWGPDVEVMAALGHGRLYGASSRVLARSLPGILDCGLWRQLELPAQGGVRALVTDVGNDILYGFSGTQILEWVNEAVSRLCRITSDVAIVDLPLENIRGLTPTQFLMWRTLLFPSCRLSFDDVLERAERISEALDALARRRGLRFCGLRREWYGIDPIHVRRSQRRAAWQEIVGSPARAPACDRWLEHLALHLRPPERRWLCGIEQVSPQHGAVLAGGARVWIF